MLGGVGWLAWKKRRPFVLVCISVLMVLSVYWTWFVSRDSSRLFAIFSGKGGELVLGALCIIGFYYRVSNRIRWDYFRFFALLLGSLVFFSQLLFWMSVARGTEKMPMGSIFGGYDSADGDMQRLIAAGFTADQLAAMYLKLAYLCLFLVGVHYLFFLGWGIWVRFFRKSPTKTF
jgi:hypothetical protein